MRKTFCMAALLGAFLVPLATQAQEVEVTANAGWVSEYWYRGIPQNSSSASAGLDLAASGFYAGTWGADVGDGAEVDIYAGYGFEVDGFSLSFGGTGYFYTGDFDDTYLEANLGAGYGPISVEFSYGQYGDDSFDDDDLDNPMYWFLGVTAERDGLFATVGTFGGDEQFYAYEGVYVEAGYGFTVADELDLSISGIYSDETLSGSDDGNVTLVFGISKTFALN